MKKGIMVTILMIAAGFSAAGAFAQTPAPESEKMRFSGYGAPVVKVSQFNSQWEVLVGGVGGVLINDNICIGGGGYGLAGTFDKKYNGTTNKIGMGYGGLLFQYYFSLKACSPLRLVL